MFYFNYYQGLIPGAFGSLVAAAAVANQQQQTQQQTQSQLQQATNQMLSSPALTSTPSGMTYTSSSNAATSTGVTPLMSGLANYGKFFY